MPLPITTRGSLIQKLLRKTVSAPLRSRGRRVVAALFLLPLPAFAGRGKDAKSRGLLAVGLADHETGQRRVGLGPGRRDLRRPRSAQSLLEGPEQRFPDHRIVCGL